MATLPKFKLVTPPFRRRFVAFLDILGFEDLTLRADTDAEARKTIRTAIGILRGANNDRTNSGYRFTHFSDSIVLTADVSASGARAIFESCCRLYILLLRRGLLLRGGLTVGNVIHETNGMLYGSGMIEAYRLDARGIPPRISITSAADAAIAEHCTAAFRRRYIVDDDYDLNPMVQVLQQYSRIGRIGATRNPGHIVTASEVAANISLQAQNDALRADIRAKWRWLRLYWNRAMGKNGTIASAL